MTFIFLSCLSHSLLLMSSTIGDCPLVVSAKTGGLGVCEREGEEPANVVAVDRVTRKMKVEVRTQFNTLYLSCALICFWVMPCCQILFLN